MGLVMTENTLREKLFMEIARYGRETGHGTDETFSCADRILALIAERDPVMKVFPWEAGKDVTAHLVGEYGWEEDAVHTSWKEFRDAWSSENEKHERSFYPDGPVMPETPSDEVYDAICELIECIEKHESLQLYTAIRAALLDEQKG